jgi:hypothetical protein
LVIFCLFNGVVVPYTQMNVFWKYWVCPPISFWSRCEQYLTSPSSTGSTPAPTGSPVFCLPLWPPAPSTALLRRRPTSTRPPVRPASSSPATLCARRAAAT